MIGKLRIWSECVIEDYAVSKSKVQVNVGFAKRDVFNNNKKIGEGFLPSSKRVCFDTRVKVVSDRKC